MKKKKKSPIKNKTETKSQKSSPQRKASSSQPLESKKAAGKSDQEKPQKKVAFGRLKVLTALGQIASAFLSEKANAY